MTFVNLSKTQIPQNTKEIFIEFLRFFCGNLRPNAKFLRNLLIFKNFQVFFKFQVLDSTTHSGTRCEASYAQEEETSRCHPIPISSSDNFCDLKSIFFNNKKYKQKIKILGKRSHENK